MTNPNPYPFWTPLLALLRSRKFLVALFAVIQTIVFVLRPDINQDVWKAIDALAAVLIASIAHEDAAKALAPIAPVAPVAPAARNAPPAAPDELPDLPAPERFRLGVWVKP